MQRLAWVRLIAQLASTPGRSAKGVGKEVLAIASKPMRPAADEIGRLREYARLRQFTERLEQLELVPAQDLWLSRSANSWSGSISSGSVEELPEWATVAGVVSRNMVTTPRGRLLLASGAGTPATDWTTSGKNPFDIAPTEAVVALSILWDYDSDVLARWFPLLRPTELITRAEAGYMMARALAQLGDDLGSSEGRPFKSLAASMQNSANEGRARGLRLHWVTPRLEQLVDTGMLLKPEPARYDYRLTPAGHRLQAVADPALATWDVIERTISPNGAMAQGASLEMAVRSAYELIKSGMGLADIDVLWTLSNAQTMTQPSPSSIPREAMDEHIRGLISTGRANFNVDRLGRVKYIRLLPD